ncbi:hypothetical protein [Clostridium beijerinckii]|uniref:hypothetical protein n=1 Tax=Clostridium beijerinckii TaxID=1520 RepID=UPI0023311916|nr:hypothetical protein [Clostridium beijerinckii]
MNMSVKKSKVKGKIKDDFSIEEKESGDIFTFSEGELKLDGTLLKSFSFDSDEELIEHPAPPTIPNNTANNNNTNSNNNNNNNNNNYSNNYSANATPNLNSHDIPCNPNDKNEILDHRTLKVNPNGRTPSVDGEAFDMVRSYTLRRSTVRILSKIKAIHIDDNVYLNTIVDEAIRYYYEYLKTQNN